MKILFIFVVFSFKSAYSDSKLNTPVKGFADLHNHMLAEYAYGGAWFHGSHQGHESEAMKECSGNADFLFKSRDHARTIIPGLNELIGKTLGTAGDTGWHLKKRDGYPHYEGWPRWDTIAHQQVWEGFLKDAHQNGLSLMVVSAVNFRPMCELMPKQNRKYSCKDMDAVDLQITKLHEFVKSRSWVELALSPEHAREIIHQGKLALVLSIEVSDLFENMNWESALDHYYQKGVRTFQIVHQLNNRFAGAAIHNNIFKFFQFLRTASTFKTDSKGNNVLGLTDEGKKLVRKMIEKNMLIDLAHLSQKGIKDVETILKEYPHRYPVYISHGHFKDVMKGKFYEYEKSSPPWVLDFLKYSQGIFGLRTGAEEVKSMGKTPNDCDGSSKSFAQAYEYGLQKGVPMAFGSDLNGFIQQLRPRFGNKKETCAASGSKKKIKAQQKSQTYMLGKSFDQSGFGHIGQIGDVVSELKNQGVDTTVLENSAEIFIQVWQRAYPPVKDLSRLPASSP